jgi:hypothetical protein
MDMFDDLFNSFFGDGSKYSFYNDDLMDLISRLEAIVGQHYHNHQKRGGFYFRYPVRIKRDDTEYECKGRIPDLQSDELESVRYVTGANELHIGVALYYVLRFLEQRYQGEINFADLEQKYHMGYYDSEDDD